MKLFRFPHYITDYGICVVSKGVYTTFIEHDGKFPEKAQKWIDRHGFSLMQTLCNRKIQSIKGKRITKIVK